MPLATHIKLSSGACIPTIGLGTWRSEPGQVASAIKHAVEVGYRHIDCAYVYDNEAEVGNTIQDLKLPRDQLFITGKLWNTFHRPEAVKPALVNTLNDLKLKYLDLYLIHWPIALVDRGDGNSLVVDDKPVLDKEVTIKQTYQAMESLVDEGLVKSIGVSNFNIRHLKEILAFARIKPAMLQVELHPYLAQNELIAFCKKNGIAVTAYSPLGSKPGKEATVLSDDIIAEIAIKNSKSPAQVLLSWAVQRGCIVIPKSVNPKRIEENFGVFELSEEDMAKISALDRGKRYVDPSGFWNVDIFEDKK